MSKEKINEQEFDEFYETDDDKPINVPVKKSSSIFNIKFSVWHILIVIILVILVSVLINIFKTRSLRNDIEEYKILLQRSKINAQKTDNYRRKYKKLKGQLTNIQAEKIDENAEYEDDKEIVKED